MAEIFAVEHDLLFRAPRAVLVNYFEAIRLGQGTRRIIALSSKISKIFTPVKLSGADHFRPRGFLSISSARRQVSCLMKIELVCSREAQLRMISILRKKEIQE
jgi:hypothetical protein